MSFTTLKGIDSISDKTISEIISENIVSYLDWGLMDKGGFYNVNINSSGLYNNNRSVLKYRANPSFTNGQVWEASNKNWVWQSGITNIIKVSGVYINNTFYPKNTVGAYSYYIDYPNGRVVFNTAISTTSTVKVEYSYKLVEISDIQQNPFFIHLQKESYRTDKSHFSIQSSGEYSKNPQTRMHIPSIAIEVPPIDNTSPYSLGTGARYSNNTVKFHIFGDSLNITRRLSDILVDQKEKTIFLFDSNLIAESGSYPLDYRGEIKAGALTYPQLLEENKYRWRKATFIDSEGSKTIQQIDQNLYHTVVKTKVETVLTKL